MIISPPVKKEFFVELVYFIISLLVDEIGDDIPEWRELLISEIEKVKKQNNWTVKAIEQKDSTKSNDLRQFQSNNQQTTRIEIREKPVDKRNYNPIEPIKPKPPKDARFFVIMCEKKEDIYQSLRYNIWSSTDYGNHCLNEAYTDTNTRQSSSQAPIYLFFSVFNHPYFYGLAEMTSSVDFRRKAGLFPEKYWWRGCFQV